MCRHLFVKFLPPSSKPGAPRSCQRATATSVLTGERSREPAFPLRAGGVAISRYRGRIYFQTHDPDGNVYSAAIRVENLSFQLPFLIRPALPENNSPDL